MQKRKYEYLYATVLKNVSVFARFFVSLIYSQHMVSANHIHSKVNRRLTKKNSINFSVAKSSLIIYFQSYLTFFYSKGKTDKKEFPLRSFRVLKSALFARFFVPLPRYSSHPPNAIYAQSAKSTSIFRLEQQIESFCRILVRLCQLRV